MRPASFKPGSIVLSFHGPLLYDAKVLQHEVRSFDEDQHWYEIHYCGWAARWDEWVEESLLLADNPQNRGRQKKLHSEYNETKTENTTTSTAKKLTSPRSGPGRKRQKTESGELPLGIGLKKALVDDMDKILKHKRLVELPAKISVSQLLDEFLTSQLKKAATVTDRTLQKVWAEMMDGLRVNFDQSLPQILLYRFERQQ
eukprot:TRINITY_DN1608_c0_g4_i12.p1 TRINITY_DN1608_c0_g4~~TRINITY_DN1608_c0_g4_i12.p1  ORF type:complete len:200 (+),score=60.34 TRINITY_DN1608_c0_g4_i12:229-828(+)